MSPTALLDNVIDRVATEPTDASKATDRPPEDAKYFRAPTIFAARPGLHVSIAFDDELQAWLAVSAEVAAHAEGASPADAMEALLDRLSEFRDELEADEHRLSDELHAELVVLRASLG